MLGTGWIVKKASKKVEVKHTHTHRTEKITAKEFNARQQASNVLGF